MTSRIKHLQLAKLQPSTRVANTKSMTPNQLKFRESGFKGFRHIPLGPCSGFKVKCYDFYSSFSSFLFLFAFSFLFHLEDYIGLHSTGKTDLLWVVNRSKAGFSKWKEVYSFSNYWCNLVCTVCDLAKRGNVQG